MWDGLITLLLLSIVMAGASFGAGVVPLAFQLSPRQLRLITALGTGILVGTSLIVIIPEGIDTLYSAGRDVHGHAERARSSNIERTALITPTIGTRSVLPVVEQGHMHFRETDSIAWPRQENAEHHESPETDPHAYVGLALISGFILMYLIDTIPQHATSPSQPQRFHINLNQFSFNRSNSISSMDPPDAGSTRTSSTSQSHSRPSSTTIGLVIHAAADGIALGASSTTTTRLTFIIFVALMIHKAPAAFGLTSVLLKQGVGKRAAKAHLLVFALAAPVGAIVTWAAAHLLGFSSSALGSSARTEFVTGVLLLFSAGTFLYVAMHTMQDASGQGEHAHSNNGAARGSNGYAGVPMHDVYGEATPAGPKETKTLTDTLVTAGGMLLPLLAQFGHAH